MSNISVLGLGAMGSRMAANLLEAGHAVTVWNRTAGACAPLIDAGARGASSPRQAAADAEIVIAMVRDDAASRAVWLDPADGALAGLRRTAIAIESSTLTPGWVRELGAHLAGSDVAFLEAPVSGSRPQAEAGQLVYFVGGDSQVLARVAPLLGALGSSIHHVGPLGHGALVKLATNSLLGTQVTALAEIIGMLERNGADPASALKAMASTSAWAPVANYLSGSMLSEDFRPQFPVELMAKDFGYAIEAAGSDAAAPTLSASGSVFRKAIDHELGSLNMTGVVKLFKATSA